MDISDGPRGRPVPALRLSLETSPADPSRVAAELEVQPSLWLMAAQAAAAKLQLTAQQAAGAVMDPQMSVNQMVKRLTGAETAVEWVRTLPRRVSRGGGA